MAKRRFKQKEMTSPKLSYRLITDSAEDCEYTIIVNDGGIAATHADGEGIIMTYYQNRINDAIDPEDVWDVLNEGNVFISRLPLETSLDDLIDNALAWLVMFADRDDFERDDTIWLNVFPNELNL